MKKFKSIISILLIIGILVGAIYFTRNLKLKNDTETLRSNVEESISNIVELSSVKYNYTDIIEYSDKKQISGIDLPFTGKSFLLKYSGYVKAGIDTDDILIKVENPDRVIVEIGDFKILDNVIDEEEVYFYNEKESVFNQLKYDELYELLKEEKLKTEKEVIEKGIYTDAKRNTENYIRSFLYGLGVKEVIFK